jgi:sugar phosphate isomerase/epimerase
MNESDPLPPTLSRRDLLRAGALGAAALTAVSASSLLEAAAQQVSRESPYWPFRMGIQSYSLRGYNFETALDKTARLGLYYWEAFQAHIPLTDNKSQIEATLAKLKAQKIRLMAWGVQGFDGNADASRKIFEFAKALKIPVITADPSRESLPILDKLVAEYKIRIAIHNHGPGSRYDRMSSVQAALKDHHPHIGVCIDTGHALRSGEDPVEWVKFFGRRVYGIHLKDVKDRVHFTEVGKGDLRTVDLLRELKRLKFELCLALEYEENEQNPIADIDRCLFATRDAVAKAIHQ